MTSYNSYDRYFKKKKPKLDKTQKNMYFNSLFEISIIAILVLATAYFFIYPTTHNLSLTKLIWMPGFIISFFSCFICISQRNDSFKPLELLTFLLLATIIISGCIISGLSADVLFSATAFMVLLLAMWLYSGVTISKRLFDIVYYFGVILSLLFIVYSFTDIARKAYIDGNFIQSVYFVFNFDNSNTTATYLYGIMCLILVNFPLRKYKAFNALLILSNFYFIYKTNSRSCLIAAIVTLFFSLFTSKKKVPTLFVIVAWLVPIIFVFVYLYMYHSGVEDIQILGKSLFSGRETVYEDYLGMLKNTTQTLFGNLGEARFQNAHNAPLSIYCSSGVIGVIISEILILTSVLKINLNSQISRVCVFVIIGYFIHSCAESIMFMGGFPGCVFVIVFYLLANYSKENSEKILFK